MIAHLWTRLKDDGDCRDLAILCVGILVWLGAIYSLVVFLRG